MKKIFWPVVAVAMIAVGVVAAACSKDTEKSKTENAKNGENEESVVVGYSDPGSLEIVSLIPKDLFLDWLESHLNSEEEGRYLAEDVKLWNDPYGDGKYAPLMSVSYFDLKEEISATLFINLDEMAEDEKTVYTMNGSSNSIGCYGGCSRCNAHEDDNGNVAWCDPCTDVMPSNLPPEKIAEWIEKHKCELRDSTLKEAIVEFLREIAETWLGW